MSWRQPGRRFNKLSVCLHRVSPLLVRLDASAVAPWAKVRAGVGLGPGRTRLARWSASGRAGPGQRSLRSGQSRATAAGRDPGRSRPRSDSGPGPGGQRLGNRVAYSPTIPRRSRILCLLFKSKWKGVVTQESPGQGPGLPLCTSFSLARSVTLSLRFGLLPRSQAPRQAQ